MTDETELFREERRVRVIDGDRPGIYILPVYHEKTCTRFGKPEEDCSCDCSFGNFEFLYPLGGPN